MKAGDNVRFETGADMLTITPFLWFDNQAEEAMNYYATVFPRAKKLAVRRAGGHVMGVEFELEGQKFIGLNGGPAHKFNHAVSFFVGCETQGQIDVLGDKLIGDGGVADQCGWLKDKFGLSWQIVPNVLMSLLSTGDDRGQRAMQAMLKMHKLEIATLQAAFDSVS